MCVHDVNNLLLVKYINVYYVDSNTGLRMFKNLQGRPYGYINYFLYTN